MWELTNALNNQYITDKKNYEDAKRNEEQIPDLKYKHKMLLRKKEDASIKKSRAIEDCEKEKEQEAENEINTSSEELKEIEEKIEKIEYEVQNTREKVESYMKELIKDSELKKQINYILNKRYERGLKRINQEKEQTDIIIDVCTEHPALEKYLKGMIRAVEELKKIKEKRKMVEKELRVRRIPSDPENLKALITQKNELSIEEIKYNNKRELNKKPFILFCYNNNININDAILDKIIEEKRFVHDEKDDIQAVKSLKEISKGYDKQKNTYEKHFEKIKEEHQEEQKNGLPDRVYKWYEFGKRFKAWKNHNVASKPVEIVEDVNVESEKYQDAYKYDIIRDYVDENLSIIFD